jgi:hypothetical protein
MAGGKLMEQEFCLIVHLHVEGGGTEEDFNRLEDKMARVVQRTVAENNLTLKTLTVSGHLLTEEEMQELETPPIPWEDLGVLGEVLKRALQ